MEQDPPSLGGPHIVKKLSTEKCGQLLLSIFPVVRFFCYEVVAAPFRIRIAVQSAFIIFAGKAPHSLIAVLTRHFLVDMAFFLCYIIRRGGAVSYD